MLFLKLRLIWLMVKQTVCTYSLAIAVYSLYLSPTTPSSEVKNTLKSRIQDSEECEKMDCIDVMNCITNHSLNSIILEAISHSYILYSYITLLYSKNFYLFKKYVF